MPLPLEVVVVDPEPQPDPIRCQGLDEKFDAGRLTPEEAPHLAPSPEDSKSVVRLDLDGDVLGVALAEGATPTTASRWVVRTLERRVTSREARW